MIFTNSDSCDANGRSYGQQRCQINSTAKGRAGGFIQLGDGTEDNDYPIETVST